MRPFSSPFAGRPGAPAGLRRVAVLTLFGFGCATVRVPASAISETVPVRGGVAEPQLELWIESGDQVSPAESAAATAQAKAALESALAGLGAPQGDSLLVVRAQGVTRTPSRRSDQRAAIAGIVVGAVVVVAAVVVLIVATQGKGGGGGSRVARHAPVPRVAPVRPAPPPGVRVPVPVFVHVPRPSPRIGVHVFAGVDVPPNEVVTAETYYAPAGPPPPAQPPPPPWPPADDLAAVSLPPPAPLDLERRGYFAKDALRLELVVVDRATGTPRWTKVVDAQVDPLDARAVEQVLRDAAADASGWTWAGA